MLLLLGILITLHLDSMKFLPNDQDKVHEETEAGALFCHFF